MYGGLGSVEALVPRYPTCGCENTLWIMYSVVQTRLCERECANTTVVQYYSSIVYILRERGSEDRNSYSFYSIFQFIFRRKCKQATMTLSKKSTSRCQQVHNVALLPSKPRKWISEQPYCVSLPVYLLVCLLIQNSKIPIVCNG